MPFIETALAHDNDENILHFGGVRIRAIGTGTLRSKLQSMDNIESDTLATITLSATTQKEPFLISNLTVQRALLRLETTAIDEFLNVSRAILYVKPIWTGYPLTNQ